MKTETCSPDVDEVPAAQQLVKDALAAQRVIEDRLLAGDDTVTAADLIEAERGVAEAKIMRSTTERLAERRRDVAAEKAASKAFSARWAEFGTEVPAALSVIEQARDDAVKALTALYAAVEDFNELGYLTRNDLSARAIAAGVRELRGESKLPHSTGKSVDGVNGQTVDTAIQVLAAVPPELVVAEAAYLAGGSTVADLAGRGAATGTLDDVRRRFTASGTPAMAAILTDA